MSAETCLVLLLVTSVALVAAGPECIKNCSTMSSHTIENTLHPISCTMETKQCNAFSNISSPPSQPKKDSENTEAWYLYPSNGVDRIALNFTWKRAHEGSVVNLQGYYFAILDNSGNVLKEMYYCIHTVMEFNLHVFAKFYYDCYGTEPSDYIKPGSRFKVFVASLPEPGPSLELHSLKWMINIPGCSDKRMANVQECIDERLLRFRVKQYVCPNRTMLIDYNVPKGHGITADIILCYAEKYRSSFNLCEMEEALHDLPLSGNGTSLVLPENFDIKANISVLLRGSNSRLQLASYIKFKCQEDSSVPNEPSVPYEPSEQSPLPIIIALCTLLALAIAVGFFIFIKRRKVKQFVESCGHEKEEEPAVPTDDKITKILNSEMVVECQTIKEVRTVCITFVEDHEMHTDVLHAFASFLQNDLGFKVVFELWEQEDIYKDASTWIDKAVTESDKVIVVWSPKAFERWTSFNKGDHETEQQDLFTPILKQIQKDLMFAKNKGKYFFTFFDYCSEKDIPEKFRDITFCHFRLMQQFKELYFRLMDREMFQPGACIKLNKVEPQNYFDQNMNKYGLALKTRIDKMCQLVKDNPNWYEAKLPTTFEIEASPSEQRNSDELLMVNMLSVAPPPPLFISVEESPQKFPAQQAPVAEVPIAVEEPQSQRQPVENIESYMAPDDGESVEQNAQLKELLPKKKSKYADDNLRLHIARRVPCENNEASKPYEREYPVLAPLNNPKNNPISPQDSGIETLSPRAESAMSDCSIHASSFHFDDDDIDECVRVGESAQTPELAPIDLTNDPWKSLASFNLQHETEAV